MADPRIQICYLRSDAMTVLRTLEELVVSLDRIGAVSSSMTNEQLNAELSLFIQQHDIFRKVAEARRIMTSPFDSAGEADELERAMDNVTYWSEKR